MFKQVHSGWPKAIRSIQNSVNMGPTNIHHDYETVLELSFKIYDSKKIYSIGPGGQQATATLSLL